MILGTQQSPIDIDPAERFETDLRTHVGWSALELEPRGRGDFSARADGALRLDGRRFDVDSLHWHFPSEHTVSGRPFAAEVHIVHAGAGGELVVLGVFLEVGESSYAPIAHTGRRVELPRDQLLPASPLATRIAGSLTTPPFDERVTFVLFDEPMPLLASEVGAENARSLQFRNRRYLLHGEVAWK